MSYHRLKEALAGAESLAESYTSSLVVPTHRESQLRTDEAAGGVASCFNVASAALVVALDHLSTWNETVRQGSVAVYANYSLARPAYECALRVLWLLDPAARPVTRIARGYAAQLDSLRWMKKFQESVGMTDGNASALYDRLLKAACREGLTVKDAKGNEHLSESVPSVVTLFETYDRPTGDLKAGWIYRFLSGHSHGFEWAAMRGAELSFSEAGMDLNKVLVDMNELIPMADRTVSAVARAVTSHINYRLKAHTEVRSH
ncbi:MAG TPA: hypothetical protein VMU51_30780 [Mycobacteriales bacterium]|nr:hypothetical protein [Mycobacteriales bacterium]